MWFKRKTKNRRLNRGHVLDVKLRSDQVRATRARMVGLGLGVLFGTVFGLYLLWRTGEWALDKFVYENSTFAIENIVMQTDGVIAPEQLRRWSNVRLGANLIALDLSTVKRNLELVSAIDSVSIERVLPRTLKISVTEREPIAQVNVPHAGAAGGVTVNIYQLDVQGHVMQPLDPRFRQVPLAQMNEQLPVITGLNLYPLALGNRIDSPQVQAALALIGAFDHSTMATMVELRRVDVSQPAVVVATTSQGSEITFALTNLEQQLGRWRKIYDLGQTMSKSIATVDLAVSNNVPVRWMAASGVPALPPKKPNPHIRRRNV